MSNLSGQSTRLAVLSEGNKEGKSEGRKKSGEEESFGGSQGLPTYKTVDDVVLVGCEPQEQLGHVEHRKYKE